MGARIELLDGVRDTIVDSTEGGRLGRAYDHVAWPRARTADGAEADLSQVTPGSEVADKLYVTEVSEGRCALLRSDGLAVRLQWDAAAVPYLGVWIDTRGAGNACVALEPCLGYPDLLAEAAQWGRHATLPPCAEFPNLTYVRVHADEGLIGLGETLDHGPQVCRRGGRGRA